jgi:hypothetical protein
MYVGVNPGGVLAMRTLLLAMLLTIATVALADDAKNFNEADVYDSFGGIMKPSADATAEEEITAIVKRQMATLLYPVDLSTFSRPEKDPKFRDLIVVLQKQMGAQPTGSLTVAQFNRLSDAADNIDGPVTGMPSKMVFMQTGDVVAASGTETGDDIADPINEVRILCYKSRGMCEMYDVSYDPDRRFLFLGLPTEYEIDTWLANRVTAKLSALCATSLMTIDIKGGAVEIVTVPQPDSTHCPGKRESPRVWKLVDGFSVAWKMGQQKREEARALMYPSARRLMPPKADYNEK